MSLLGHDHYHRSATTCFFMSLSPHASTYSGLHVCISVVFMISDIDVSYHLSSSAVAIRTLGTLPIGRWGLHTQEDAVADSIYRFSCLGRLEFALDIISLSDLSMNHVQCSYNSSSYYNFRWIVEQLSPVRYPPTLHSHIYLRLSRFCLCGV